MFGRKAKREKIRIEGFDERGHRVLDCDAVEFVLPEPVLLELSMEYFQDPNPCEIHRAAVQRRATMELIGHCGLNKRTMMDDLPEAQRRYFPEGISAVCIRGEAS